MIPNKWSFDHFEECESVETDQITLSILYVIRVVYFEAFLWGFGTALGELPPYFVARAASLAGNVHEELEEMRESSKDNSSGIGFMDKAKAFMYNHLQENAFITVLLAASIPNPLFDLAGLTCGHFLVPFATFFSACMIGKAVIKVLI